MPLKDKVQDMASGLVHKVDEVLQKKNNQNSTTTPANATTNTTHNNNNINNPASSNHGPHSSNLANKADPTVDSDLDNRNTLGSSTGPTHSTHTSSTTYDNPSSTNAGPHSSNAMNKLDPRVDSDRDGRNDPTSHTGGLGNTQTGGSYGNTSSTIGSGTGHTHGAPATSTYGNTTFDNPQSSNAGPHKSEMMNKLDPRVDSDRDGRNNPTSNVGGLGNTQTHNTHHNHGNTFGGASTTPGSTTLHDDPRSTNAGPHSSNVMNELDPRVDSDRDGRNHPTSTFGNSGGLSSHPNHNNTSSYTDSPQSTNAGPHDSNLMNKLDPRVDSDRDGRNNPTSNVGGLGQTQNTGYSHTTNTSSANPGIENHKSTNSGPHGSNLMNKLDPRVDSDRDGSNVRTSQY